MRNKNLNKLVKVSVLSALSFVLMLIEFPLPIFPEFLKIDLGDIPAIIGGFALGPFAGFLIELIKNLLHLSITKTLGIGELANFAVGAAFVMASSELYKRNKNKKNAVKGLIAGTIAMTLAAGITNYYIFIPLYSKFLFPASAMIAAASKINPGVKDISTYILYAIMPFNLIKGVVVSIITLLMYKKVSPILHK